MRTLSANVTKYTDRAARFSSRPFLSIGICTFKRNEPLIELLESIGAQTGQIDADIVILIVDNNPIPSVPLDCVRNSTPYSVKVVHEPHTGLVHARNRLFDLAEESGVDWLIGVDDDVIAEPDWLSEWIRGLNAARTDILIGSVKLKFHAGASPYLSRRPFSNPEVGKEPRVLATTNYAVSQRVFSQSKGLALRYHPAFNHIGGEDAEFFLRAKRQHGYATGGWPSALVTEAQNGHRGTLRYHLNRTLCTQMNAYYIAALHRRDRLMDKPAPLALMLTRRTVKNLVSGFLRLGSGIAKLPYARTAAQQTIGMGLSDVTRAFAVVPYILGKKYRRYGNTATQGTN
ncbi:Glycosyltransferase, GT2 family [Yoonia rosea]|uniref:Glycosyltransferase, GT2 family n=1 Tax=Yoonia rosea TaxID=287098 RepID=A0A1R3WGP8_9RHOB|nr:glycosyltransferase [Yoonia rosea]SIT77117.1 Glycosyltransferase, GT2 family [Yoonia rosea]